MSDYTRTALRRLGIRGFRSIRELELDAIPDLVVLHGPNGSGKSNLLLAVQLLLRAAAIPGDLPLGREQARVLPLPQAEELLGLRPDDFHHGAAPELGVRIEVALGTRAVEMIALEKREAIGRLHLELIVQQTDDASLSYYFERADIDGKVLLGSEHSPEREKLREEMRRAELDGAALRRRADRLSREIDTLPTSFAALERANELRGEVDQLRVTSSKRLEEAKALKKQLNSAAFLEERLRHTLLTHLLQVSPAYRVPGGAADPEEGLYRALVSENRREREATRRLSRRLATAGLFGEPSGSVALLPVESATYGEKQVRLTHPTHGDLPLRNLGSGEQQIVYMLAQRVITPFPIAQLEEPEAHLYSTLMASFARVLYESVEGEGGVPDVDQLFIATHHHHFALALEYFDVSLKDGRTVVQRLPRAKAARHFYEPGPIWEALRQLASSAKEGSAVVFRNGDGQPVTAQEVLDSIEKDPDQTIAKEYASAMTEAMVRAMRQRAEGRT